jgi:glycosyltransferase involved in cell wall biosynthesis
MKQGIIIPLYNHGKALRGVVAGLSAYGAPVIIVDDGSCEETKKSLMEILADFPLAQAVTLEKNSGKGRAVAAGIQRAHELGLSHVLQIDADGQHDAGRAAFFFEESARHPAASICSFPEYDGTAPQSRKNGRKVANAWAKIVTLSGGIADALCGFRVYPVETCLKILKNPFIDKRMGFDPEILVRLCWAGTPLLFFPVRVTYPGGGISHFRMFEDNVRISWVFTRLFAGMLLRLPLLVARKCMRKNA